MFFWRVYELSFVFGWFSRKMDESGVLPREVGIPCTSIGPRQGMACPHRGVAKREVWAASGTPRGSKATPRLRSTSQRSIVHNMKIFMLCFVLLFRYSEDLSI